MQKTKKRIKRLHSEIALLLRILDHAYHLKAWHGPNLRGSIRGLSARQAEWRPDPQRRSIADIVVHAAYWKYAVRRRLRSDKRGSFVLKGSNWFRLPSPLADSEWRMYVTLLEEEHRALREAIHEFEPERLHHFPAKGKVPYATLIYGVVSHDLYHTGQIQLLKRLMLSCPK